MVNETDNLVLEHLRALRADVSDVKSDVRDIRSRIASIEVYTATLHSDQARGALAIEELTHRIERLEKRTGLLD